MVKAIPLEVDRDSHLVEPPIVDFLCLDETRQAYIVAFIPEDSVSSEEKEDIEIPEGSSDGQRIALQLGLTVAEVQKYLG